MHEMHLKVKKNPSGSHDISLTDKNGEEYTSISEIFINIRTNNDPEVKVMLVDYLHELDLDNVSIDLKKIRRCPCCNCALTEDQY